MTFRPSYWRCCFTFLLPWLLGILSTAIFDPYTSALPMSFPVWVGGKVAGFAGAASAILLMTPWVQDRLSITLDDEFVAGPNGKWWRWGRVDLPLDKLDRERTCRQTILQRLLGARYLWSTDGQKIRIDYWAFTPAQVMALLRSIGCGKEQRA